MKSLFEQMAGTYTEVNGYLIPNLILRETTDYEIGRYGRMHMKYIKEHKRVLYTNLLTAGKLNPYLYDIDD